MCSRAVDIAERALGRNHPNVAVALTNLGTLEVNRNMYEKAEKYFSEALAIHKVGSPEGSSPSLCRNCVRRVALF